MSFLMVDQWSCGIGRVYPFAPTPLMFNIPRSIISIEDDYNLLWQIYI